MSEQVITDPWAFARGRETLVGKIAFSAFDRVQELLARSDGEIDFRISGFLSAKGEPGLRYAIHGELELICQRCLEPMAYPLELQVSVLLAHEASPVQEDDPDTPDFIQADKDLSVKELIEEEILLSLPMAPHHAEGQCKAKAQDQSDKGKAHPFAALARLKTDHD